MKNIIYLLLFIIFTPMVVLGVTSWDAVQTPWASNIDAGSYDITSLGMYSSTADSDTIADTGDASPATATLNPTSNVVLITCSDANTCDITMGETDTTIRVVRIVNVSANVVDFADSAGVSELAGAFAAGINDTITLQYTGSTWVEITRSDN